MTFPTILFYVFSAILVFAALRVVTARNPVHAALWLVLSFVTAAAHWLMLQAEFLAIVLVVVFVGAGMVVFLFVIIMLDVNYEHLRRHFRSYLPVGIAVGMLVGFEMALLLLGSYLKPVLATSTVAAGTDNTKMLGRMLYTDYVYAFEIAAVVLLVAIVAAIVLTHRTRRPTKYQNPNEQVKVRPRDRLRVLSMPSEKREAVE